MKKAIIHYVPIQIRKYVYYDLAITWRGIIGIKGIKQ